MPVAVFLRWVTTTHQDMTFFIMSKRKYFIFLSKFITSYTTFETLFLVNIMNIIFGWVLGASYDALLKNIIFTTIHKEHDFELQ